MSMTNATQLRRMMEQTLVPPTQVVELDPSTVDEATSRLGSVKGNLAEHYQVNSCLSRTAYARLADREEIETLTDFYLTTAGEGYETLVAEESRWVRPLTSCPTWVQQLLGPLAGHPAVQATLYNADLLVGFEDALWRLVPGQPGLQLEGTWSPELGRTVREAVPAMAGQGPAQGVVMLVGHLGRASYLSGDRAFRAAAIATGTLLGFLWSHLSGQPPFLRMQVTQQFIDHEVNEAARCDGVERGVQVLAFVDPLSHPVDPPAADPSSTTPSPAQEPA